MIRQLVGDCRETLRTLEPGSVQACITSPPYYGLRDYGTPPLVWGQTCCEHAHQWGADERGPWANELPSAKSVTKRNNAFHDSMGKTAGSFCTHVHEWGEPTIAHAASYESGEKARWNHRVNGRREAQERILAKEPGWTRKDVEKGSVCACGAWLGSLGLEPTPELYLQHLVEVFREVRRVLRDDGTLWVNLGDSYAGSGKGLTGWNGMQNAERRQGFAGGADLRARRSERPREDVKPKDLQMMPARVALALQQDGWYLRSMIPWLKRNSMPESVADRPATSVEYVFLLSKSRTYFWDADAVRMLQGNNTHSRGNGHTPKETAPGTGVKANSSFHAATNGVVVPGGRSRRNSDWFMESWQGLMLDEHDDPLALVVNPMPFKGSHFATFPPRLVEPMVKASTSEKGQCPECGAPWVRITEQMDSGRTQKMADGWDTGAGAHDTIHRNGREKGEAGVPVLVSQTVGWRASCAHSEASPVPQVVLDCFGGAGTVGLVADRLGRDAVLCELKPGYGDMAAERLVGDAPMFVELGA